MQIERIGKKFGIPAEGNRVDIEIQEHAMCGFVGFVSQGEFAGLKEDLPKAVSSLSHRGPDDDGLYYDASLGVGLAHRRLSILDLFPMTIKRCILSIMEKSTISGKSAKR